MCSLEEIALTYVGDVCSNDVFFTKHSAQERIRILEFLESKLNDETEKNSYILQCIHDEMIWCQLYDYINGHSKYCPTGLSVLERIDPFKDSILYENNFHSRRNTHKWQERRSQYIQNTKVMKFWLIHYIHYLAYDCINALMYCNILPMEIYQTNEVKQALKRLNDITPCFIFITEPRFWKYLYVDVALIEHAFNLNNYKTFDELCSSTWGEHSNFQIESLIKKCICDKDDRFIDRLSIKKEVMDALIHTYTKNNPSSLHNGCGIVKKFLFDYLSDGLSSNNKTINQKNFDILYTRMSIYFYGLITTKVPKDCISAMLMMTTRMFFIHSPLPNELTKTIMLYLYGTNSNADAVLSMIVNQVYVANK